MQLLEWIKEKGYTQREVAKMLNLSTSRLCRICSGHEPDLKEVMAIETLTRRKVRMEDFLTALKPKEGNKL